MSCVAIADTVFAHRLAAKEASRHDQGSVAGDVAQPLTRRHSRTSSSGSLPTHARTKSGGLIRGASTSLVEDWQVIPKAPLPGLPKTPSGEAKHAQLTACPVEDEEYAKKDD